MRRALFVLITSALLILTLPTVSHAQPPSGLSPQFRRDGVESVNAMEEWQDMVAYAVKNGYPVADYWVSAYDEKAAGNLRLAFVSAKTATDRAALQLLSNQFNNVQAWSANLVEARTEMDAELTIAPDEMYDDPLFQKISQCRDVLSAMLVSGSYQDDPACR